MIRNSTHIFLLKYLYKETDLFETLEVEYAIEDNNAVKKEFKKLKKMHLLLSSLQFTPSNNCINNILNYSSKTNLQKVF
jgi:hypothetical protein